MAGADRHGHRDADRDPPGRARGGASPEAVRARHLGDLAGRRRGPRLPGRHPPHHRLRGAARLAPGQRLDAAGRGPGDVRQAADPPGSVARAGPGGRTDAVRPECGARRPAGGLPADRSRQGAVADGGAAAARAAQRGDPRGHRAGPPAGHPARRRGRGGARLRRARARQPAARRRRAAGPEDGAGRRHGHRRRRPGHQLRRRGALRASSTRDSGWASDEHPPRARACERTPAGTRPGAPRPASPTAGRDAWSPAGSSWR